MPPNYNAPGGGGGSGPLPELNVKIMILGDGSK